MSDRDRFIGYRNSQIDILDKINESRGTIEDLLENYHLEVQLLNYESQGLRYMESRRSVTEFIEGLKDLLNLSELEKEIEEKEE